jgi:hypothetical protein
MVTPFAKMSKIRQEQVWEKGTEISAETG